MVREIKWSESSQNQLVDILQYWELRNGTKAYSLRLSDFIQEALSLISRFLKLGRATSKSTIRCKIVHTYLLYYSWTESTIFVVALCDMRRSPKSIRSLTDKTRWNTKEGASIDF